MSTVFKIFIAIISAVFMVMGGFAVTLGFSSAVATNNYLESVSNRIVESYYNDEIIADCIQDAADKGYVLSVVVEGGDKPGEIRYAKIQLKYDFKLGIFEFEQQKTKTKVL